MADESCRFSASWVLPPRQTDSLISPLRQPAERPSKEMAAYVASSVAAYRRCRQVSTRTAGGHRGRRGHDARRENGEAVESPRECPVERGSLGAGAYLVAGPQRGQQLLVDVVEGPVDMIRTTLSFPSRLERSATTGVGIPAQGSLLAVLLQGATSAAESNRSDLGDLLRVERRNKNHLVGRPERGRVGLLEHLAAGW